MAFAVLTNTASAVSDNVMLRDMVTNDKHVVLLYMDGEYRNGGQLRYTLGCNQDQPTCNVPDKGRYYHMETSDQTTYKCPEVTLSGDGKQIFGVYCLNELH